MPEPTLPNPTNELRHRAGQLRADLDDITARLRCALDDHTGLVDDVLAAAGDADLDHLDWTQLVDTFNLTDLDHAEAHLAAIHHRTGRALGL